MAANPHTPPKRSRSVSERRPVRRAKASDPEERRELIRRAATRVRTKASIDFLRDGPRPLNARCPLHDVRPHCAASSSLTGWRPSRRAQQNGW
jgi:hypothetical protein